jgi:Tfp pilus assembly PilM family ATPase
MFKKPRLIINGDQDGITGKIINKNREMIHSFRINVPFSLTDISIEELEQATEVLSNHVYDPYRVLIIVDGKLAFFRSFITSYKNKMELKKGLEYEISSRVPMPVEQIRWDYTSKKLDNGFFVNVGGVKKERINLFMHLLGKLRIKPNTMTIEPMLLNDYIKNKYVKKTDRKEDVHIFFLEDAIHYLVFQNGNFIYYRKLAKSDLTSGSQLAIHTEHAIRETGKENPTIVHYVLDEKQTDYQIDEMDNSITEKIQDNPLLPFR